MDVKGKVAIVTGASSGIGEATACLLSRFGAKVILAARSADKLKQLEKELENSFAITTDITKEEDRQNLIKKTLEKFGRIDILVNNAGRGYDIDIENINLDNYRELIELNLIAGLDLMKKVIPIMKKQKEGIIINISSGTSLMAIPRVGAYSSLKRALVGLSLTARAELEKEGIKVSVVYPFITATNFYKNVLGGARENHGVRSDRDLPEADSAEYVAEKILEAIKIGEAEVYAHEWMKERRRE